MGAAYYTNKNTNDITISTSKNSEVLSTSKNQQSEKQTIIRIPEKPPSEYEIERGQREYLERMKKIEDYGLISYMITTYYGKNEKRTFNKKPVKQYCDIKTLRKEYTFTNDSVIINIGKQNVGTTNVEIRIMKDMWITNVDNILHFEMSLLSDLQNESKKNVLCNLSITALRNINKMMYGSEYDDNVKLNMLRIPIDEYSIISGLAEGTLMINIMTIDQLKTMLHVNYKIVTEDIEKKRFDGCFGHEYLIRQYITVKKQINIGENVLEMAPNKLEIACMFINSKKSLNLDISSNMYHVYNYGDENVKLYLASQDPQYKKYEIESHDTYIYDVYKNINNSTSQPFGTTLLNEKTKFYITSPEYTDIEITYVTYNVCRYLGKKIDFVIAYFNDTNKN